MTHLVHAHITAGIADGDVCVGILVGGEGFDAGGVPGEVRADDPVGVLRIDGDDAQRHLDTLGGHLADILVQGVGEVGARGNHDRVHQEVVGPAIVVFHAAAEAVPEEPEVQADVLGGGHLPLDGAVKSGGAVGRIPGAAVQIGVVLVGDVVAGLVGVAGADILLAGLSVAGAQLEFIYETQVPDEGLAVQFPGDGRGGEEAPAVTVGKVLRAVVAEVELGNISVVIGS